MVVRCLTFDMRRGAKGAKRPLGRRLDGRVRRHFGCSRKRTTCGFALASSLWWAVCLMDRSPSNGAFGYWPFSRAVTRARRPPACGTGGPRGLRRGPACCTAVPVKCTTGGTLHQYRCVIGSDFASSELNRARVDLPEAPHFRTATTLPESDAPSVL